MRGKWALRHRHPREAPRLFFCFGISMGGLPSPPLLTLVVMGCLQPPPLIFLVIVVGLPSPHLPLGLCGPRQDRHIGQLFWFWGALLLQPFLRLSLMRSRMFHHWR